MGLDVILALIIITWGFLYSLSYGRWEWKNKNKLAAIAVFSVSAFSAVFPIYVMFFR